LTASFEAEPNLEAEIRQHQKDDKKLQEIRGLLKVGKAPYFREDCNIQVTRGISVNCEL
jgi:hypothetical protein